MKPAIVLLFIVLTMSCAPQLLCGFHSPHGSSDIFHLFEPFWHWQRRTCSNRHLGTILWNPTTSLKAKMGMQVPTLRRFLATPIGSGCTVHTQCCWQTAKAQIYALSVRWRLRYLGEAWKWWVPIVIWETSNYGQYFSCGRSCGDFLLWSICYFRRDDHPLLSTRSEVNRRPIFGSAEYPKWAMRPCRSVEIPKPDHSIINRDTR